MLENTLDAIRFEKAKLARETEYLKETSLDDMIDERIEVAESLTSYESTQELLEAADMVNQLSGEPDLISESIEIERILNAEEDLTFNEMAGIE